MNFRIVLALIALILFSSSSVLAQEDNIGTSLIDPSSPFYFLKTIRESLELKFALTPHTILLRRLEFATRRLRETKTLVSKNEDLIPSTLERYNSQLATLSDKDLNDQEVAMRVKESLAVHLNVLQKIYSQVSSLRAKMFIMSALNRIILRADIPNYSKLPLCNFFTKEASSSGLNDVEKVVLFERADRCKKSLATPSAHL